MTESTKKDIQKFTWKIENFSKLNDTTPFFSDTFYAGGYRWRIGAYKKRYDHVNIGDAVSVFLSFLDWRTMPDHGGCGWSVPADFSLTVVDQLNGTSCIKRGCKHTFKKGVETWGWKHEMVALQDPSKGFIVNDTLQVKAKVSIIVQPASDHHVEAKEIGVDEDQPQDAIIVGPWPKPALSQESHHHHHHHEPQEATTKEESSTEPALPPQKSDQVDIRPHSPSTVQLMSRNLIAELSSIMTSNDHHGNSSPNNPDDHDCGSSDQLLQQKREKLVGFLGMSLEAICETKSINEVESLAQELAELATDPVEKIVLKDLITRLAEFKEIVLGSLTTIETSKVVESSAAGVTKEMEARLAGSKRKLSSLEMEVSKLGEEDVKLEAEIQRLTARREEVIGHRTSAVVELEKTNREVSKELDDLKKQRGESKQAVEIRMRAKEKLAQANVSWNLFKENLGW